MTKIVMSDTNSLKENSTQNTFLSLMFAVAYSIGPVYIIPFAHTRLIAGPWWCFDISLVEMVLRDQSSYLRCRSHHLLLRPPQESPSLNIRHCRRTSFHWFQAPENRLPWPRLLLGILCLHHSCPRLGRKYISLDRWPRHRSARRRSNPFDLIPCHRVVI